jgi:hypothetical protein
MQLTVFELTQAETRIWLSGSSLTGGFSVGLPNDGSLAIFILIFLTFPAVAMLATQWIIAGLSGLRLPGLAGAVVIAWVISTQMHYDHSGMAGITYATLVNLFGLLFSGCYLPVHLVQPMPERRSTIILYIGLIGGLIALIDLGIMWKLT